MGAVKTEFGKFEESLTKMQRYLDSTSKELDNLITTRSNQMSKRLRDVERLDDLEAARLLDLDKKSHHNKA